MYPGDAPAPAGMESRTWVGGDRACRYASFNSANGYTQIYSGAAILHGWILAEPTGSAGTTFHFVDGQVSGDPMVGQIHLGNSASSQQLPGPKGVLCAGGLGFSVTGGVVTGAVFYIPIDYIPPNW